MADHQASSSSSSSDSSYQVFLSFSGIDVRTNFADYLYNALVYAGIRAFRDENELPKGNKIGPELLAAIQQSRISIPIFSENYASSKWCLNELTQISECRRTMDQIVLPIFYKVEPRDVRNQTGRYAKDFEEHQMSFNETTVQKWKEALREVGELDGWHAKEGTYEGQLTKTIVKEVWRTLNKGPLMVSDNLVGIQFHIKKMLMLLDIESDEKKFVGIYGLGGIGKTTIARAVYDTVIPHFDGYSFIEDINENAKKYGLPHLQNQLIFSIMKQENLNITSVKDGIDMIKQILCQRKVIIVLDDVDQDIQAESLVGDGGLIGIGSKIIITSRNKDILRKTHGIYEPDVMEFEDSLALFSYHAFGRDQPREDYLDLSKAMIETTGGLPLALKVIGSSLYLKAKAVWKDMLKELQEVPNNDVMKSLKISYDGLDYGKKQMFLDIACFFIGMNKDIACHIWDGCGLFPKVGLDTLCVRSLVTIGEEDELRMHDLLRDLGRYIVRQENIDEPGNRSRIWSEEDVLDVLEKRTGTSNVKGLSFGFEYVSMSEGLMIEGFVAMTNLRLLKINYAYCSRNSFTHSFSELRWFNWRDRGCSDQYVVTNFCPRKLALLDLSHSWITKKWIGWNGIKMAVNLKVLNLMSCHQLFRTPDLSANRGLKVLILEDCRNLVEIDTSIGYLQNLVILDMSNCLNLVDLPIEICQLTSLERFSLEGCENLKKLPEKLGHMISLIGLDLRGCKRLKSLPMLSSLKNLEELRLHGSEKLLYISNLPSSLIILAVGNCSSLRCISGLPASLARLDVELCNSLAKLSSTSGLINLERLFLRDCNNLEEIEGVDDEGLDSLVAFSISSCRLKKFPKLTGAKNLREVSLCVNDFITDIEGNEMVSLEKLVIWSYKSLRKLNLADSKMLRELYIRNCQRLSQIERLEDFESLEKFKIIDAHSLKILPDVSTLKNLSYFEISGCWLMERVPDLSNLNKLQKLMIEKCEKITEIPGIGRLESLRELTIKGCQAIEIFPDQLPENLNYIWITGCKTLPNFYGVDRLEVLEKLKPLELSLADPMDIGCDDIECPKETEMDGSDRFEFIEDYFCP